VQFWDAPLKEQRPVVDQVSAKAAGTDTSAKEPTKANEQWSRVVSQGWADAYSLVDALIWKQAHQHRV